jgi:predicted ATPase
VDVWQLPILGSTHAALGKFDDARRYVAEAMNSIKTNKEKWFEAEVNRVAGEIALKSPAPHTAKAEGYFERALAVARQQQAKSWELRASMSSKLANCSLRCMGGLPKASTPST